MTDRQTVEAMIRETVYDAALLRAQANAQKLRSVAREILFEQAALARPVDEARPTARVIMNQRRRRLRFPVSRASYEQARDKLHASGVSVTAALEDGLERFARTGEFKETT